MLTHGQWLALVGPSHMQATHTQDGHYGACRNNGSQKHVQREVTVYQLLGLVTLSNIQFCDKVGASTGCPFCANACHAADSIACGDELEWLNSQHCQTFLPTNERRHLAAGSQAVDAPCSGSGSARGFKISVHQAARTSKLLLKDKIILCAGRMG